MDILIYGIINSSMLALMALGFALVYGTSRIPNFAHGAIYVLCGFITWVFVRSLELNYLLSIIISLAITGFIGALIYRFVLIRVRGMDISEIIASYAIGLAIIETLRWGGFKGTTYTLPVIMEGSVMIGDIPVDYQRILVVVLGVAVVAFLWLFTHYTRIGLALRGMAQDERAALMLGIDSDTMAIVAMAFGCHVGRVCRHCDTASGQYRGGKGLQCAHPGHCRLHCRRIGELDGRRPCRFYYRICADTHNRIPWAPIPDGGGLPGYYFNADSETVGSVRTTERTGREGLTWIGNKVERKGLIAA